jgi:hypothetical protein
LTTPLFNNASFEAKHRDEYDKEETMKTATLIKGMILTAMTAAAFTGQAQVSSAPASEPKLKPTRYVQGTVRVNRSWLEKKEDGSFEAKSDTVCKTTVKVPVYEQATTVKNIDVEDLKVSTCETENQNKKPVTLVVYGSLSLNDIPDFEGAGKHIERAFSGSYAVTKSPITKNGSFAAFSSRDLQVKSGSLILPAPFPSYKSKEEAFEDTLYAVVLSYEE